MSSTRAVPLEQANAKSIRELQEQVTWLTGELQWITECKSCYGHGSLGNDECHACNGSGKNPAIEQKDPTP